VDPPNLNLEGAAMSLERGIAPDPFDILPAKPSFELTSNDFADGEPLDKRHAHESVGGENVSPHLRWSGFPAETKSFALTCFDPDAPTGSGFWHWVLVDIPADTTELLSDASKSGPLPAGSFSVRSDYGRPGGAAARRRPATGRTGTCSPCTPSTSSGSAWTRRRRPAYVGFNLAFHTLARGVLRGTYQIPG
jgi:Raf kinase inhibitor-like YbhB/YbcL family protein